MRIRRHTDSPTIAAILRSGAEPTLDRWLSMNNVLDDDYDAEMLEVVPTEFHDEYIERLNLQREYKQKFEQRVPEGTVNRK
jgi:hypothetical protein